MHQHANSHCHHSPVMQTAAPNSSSWRRGLGTTAQFGVQRPKTRLQPFYNPYKLGCPCDIAPLRTFTPVMTISNGDAMQRNLPIPLLRCLLVAFSSNRLFFLFQTGRNKQNAHQRNVKPCAIIKLSCAVTVCARTHI